MSTQSSHLEKNNLSQGNGSISSWYAVDLFEKIQHPNIHISNTLSKIFQNSKYIKILNRVYPYTVDSSLLGTKFLTSPQVFNDLTSELNFKNDVSQRISFQFRLSSYETKKDNLEDITSLSLKIIFANKSTTLLTIDDLEISFRNTYKNNYLTEKQTVTFAIKDVIVSAIVNQFFTKEFHSYKKNSNFGRITDSSSVNISLECNNLFHFITEKPLELLLPRVNWKAKLGFHLEKKFPFIKPYFISHKHLEKLLREQYSDLAVYPYLEKVLKTEDGFQIIIEAVSIQDIITNRIFSERKNILQLSEKVQLAFESDSTVITIGNDTCKPIQALFVKIQNLRCHDLMVKSTSEVYFFTEEILEALINTYGNEVWKSSYWHIVLKDINQIEYSADLEILDADFEDLQASINKKNFIPEKWIISTLTELIIEKNSDLNVKISKSRTVKQASRVFISAELNYKHQKSAALMSKEKLKNYLRSNLQSILVGQTHAFVDKESLYNLTIDEITLKEPTSSLYPYFAKIEPSTKFIFKTICNPKENKLPFTIYSEKEHALYDMPVKEAMLKLGIGGLSEENLRKISRLKNSISTHKELFKHIGKEPIHGVLLSGPTGTGKTKLAQAIARYLGIKPENRVTISPKDLIDCKIGKTEKNIGKLFEAANVDYSIYGDKAEYRLIILEEVIDSIGKERSSSDKTWEISQVGQFLVEMDNPTKPWPNLIVIATTNLPKVIDPALLRPKRFGLKLEIGLPKNKGRIEILSFHVKKLKKDIILNDKVNLHDIAVSCKGFSGAELEDLVNLAVEHATETKTEIPVQIMQEDFDWALKNLKKPVDHPSYFS